MNKPYSPLIKIHIIINFVIVILPYQHENGRLGHDEIILAFQSIRVRPSSPCLSADFLDNSLH